MRGLLGFLILPLLALWGQAAEVLPPAPPRHFNDQAGLVSAAVARQLDAELAQFERDTSNQLLVAIYPHMQSDSSIEDYSQRVAQSWHAGTQGRNNGAVLFIFSADHKLYIQVGYGLEGVLPDALCKRIVDDVITPHFRQGDFSGGVTAGVHAMIAATKGEYKGTGRTVGEGHRRQSFNIFPIAFIIIIIAGAVGSRRRRDVYGRSGRSTIWFGGGGGGWGGGSSGGFGGGGGFSGGGGSFGGGGAGGSW